jgi:pyruvate dehydrogenase E2 component (dihydrolipoamide acetyltransferase)
MAVEVRMPAYSESMEEADVVGWLVAPGDRVGEGDPIAEIETDKATGELESPVSGVLSEILIAEGTQGVKVGELLARIEPSAGASAGDSSPMSQSEPAGEPSSPAEPDRVASLQTAGPPEGTKRDSKRTNASTPLAETFGETRPSRAHSTKTGSAPVQATALARRLADRAGLELTTIAGSGASGRVLKADVEALTTAPVTAEPHASAAAANVPHAIPERAVSQLRVVCRADRARAACKRLSARESDTPIPMLALILRAAAGALREVPQANLAWRNGALVQLDSIAIALGQSSASGEGVGLVRDADRMSLSALAELITPVEENSVPADSETTLAALAVVDVGGAAIESIRLPVSPPGVLALGTGAPTERPMAVDGALGVGFLMTCTLTADSRAVDAGCAARLLEAFRLRLEEPLEMVLR